MDLEDSSIARKSISRCGIMPGGQRYYAVGNSGISHQRRNSSVVFMSWKITPSTKEFVKPQTDVPIGEIGKITDVYVNKLHQPGVAFVAVINNVSQWTLTYQVENKYTKKGYMGCTTHASQAIVNFFMSKIHLFTKEQINWANYARDDPMFTQINVISRHEDTQLYGEVPPKTKASVHKKKADSDTTPKEKPPTDPKDKRVKQTGKMTGSGKQKQPATGDGVDILSKVPDEQVHEKTGTDEGAGDKPEVPDVPEHHSNSEEESWTFSDGDDDG
ncbi:hypothetical protein Tco_0017358 [Tanacetum coccineum]